MDKTMNDLVSCRDSRRVLAQRNLQITRYPSLSMNNFPHVDIELPAVNTAPCKLLFQSTNLFVCLLLIMFFFLSSQIHCFKSFCLLFMTLGLIFNIRDVYSSSNNGTFFLLIQYKLAFSACISCFF